MGMEVKENVQKTVDAFIALDKARNELSEDLVKAANEAFGAEVFRYAGFVRYTQGIGIKIEALIPCENLKGFQDVE